MQKDVFAWLPAFLALILASCLLLDAQAEVSGEVVKIMIDNGKPITAGQVRESGGAMGRQGFLSTLLQPVSCRVAAPTGTQPPGLAMLPYCMPETSCFHTNLWHL